MIRQNNWDAGLKPITLYLIPVLDVFDYFEILTVENQQLIQ